MIAPEIVDRIRELADLGQGSKRIARRLRISRNTVRRYLDGAKVGFQERPARRLLDNAALRDIQSLYLDVAQGNAVVVQHELAERGVEVELRTLQRALAPLRREARAQRLATTRFETDPGRQLQIDFGEKRIVINGNEVVVHLMNCVLGFSRRGFCRAFLAERQDDWFEGIDAAFRHFGGMTEEILCDNASPLVQSHDPRTGVVAFHPGFEQFRRDRGVTPKACKPHRPRTKGKIERTVGYVKRNALAGRTFASFAALQRHLLKWQREIADRRIHGTTRERPIERFEREKPALAALPGRPLAVRTRRLTRRVTNDCFVDIDTIRYSVPYRFIKEKVEVVVGLERVEVWLRGERIAEHARSNEPHSLVRDPQHFHGLTRPDATVAVGDPAADASRGRDERIVRPLSVYAAVVEGGRR